MKHERQWAPAVAAWLITGGLLAACGGGVDGIDGTISGLTADGLELSDGNGTLSIDAGSTSFSFDTLLDSGDAYVITVTAQPTGLHCSITDGSGVVGDETSISVGVSCTPVYGISGVVDELTTSGLVLRLRSGDDEDSLTEIGTLEVASGAASFAFAERLEDGTFYEVTVETQPSSRECVVTGGTGEVERKAVTDIEVDCN